MPNSISNNKTVVFLKGSSQYNVTLNFIDGFVLAFKKLGYDTNIVNLNALGWQEDLEQILKEKDVFFFFTICGAGFDIRVGDKSLFDYLDIPLFSYQVDHPIFNLQKIDCNVNNLIVACVDNTHKKFLEEYVPSIFSKVFIPHATFNSIVSDYEVKPIKERSIDILFAGSFSDPDEIRQKWIKDNTGFIRSMMDDITEQAMYQSDEPLIKITEKVLEYKGLDIGFAQNRKIWNVLTQIDSYIRCKRRMEVIERLSCQNLHIFGNGWNKFKSAHNKIQFHSSVDFIEINQKMKDSKIVLNVLPNFIYGGHERIFSSMLNGAVCLTDSNRYLEKHFVDKENILFYDINDVNLSNKLTVLLQDTDNLNRIANKGMEIVTQYHTWMNRANQVLEAVVFHKLFAPRTIMS